MSAPNVVSGAGRVHRALLLTATVRTMTRCGRLLFDAQVTDRPLTCQTCHRLVGS